MQLFRSSRNADSCTKVGGDTRCAGAPGGRDETKLAAAVPRHRSTADAACALSVQREVYLGHRLPDIWARAIVQECDGERTESVRKKQRRPQRPQERGDLGLRVEAELHERRAACAVRDSRARGSKAFVRGDCRGGCGEQRLRLMEPPVSWCLGGGVDSTERSKRGLELLETQAIGRKAPSKPPAWLHRPVDVAGRPLLASS